MEEQNNEEYIIDLCDEFNNEEFDKYIREEIDKFIKYLSNDDIDKSLNIIYIRDNLEELNRLAQKHKVDDSIKGGGYCNKNNNIYVYIGADKNNIKNELALQTIFHEIVHASLNNLEKQFDAEFLLFLNEYLANYISFDYLFKIYPCKEVRDLFALAVQSIIESWPEKVQRTLKERIYEISSKLGCKNILKKYEFEEGINNRLCDEINLIIENKNEKYINLDEAQRLEKIYKQVIGHMYLMEIN